MSASSLEGSPVPLDLPAKYQKLAAEYAKIRAQCGVLKKAVIDEQNQTAELKQTLKITEQHFRKAEQEIDSLNFRNQQLTKRVTILQDELDSIQNSSKFNKSKGKPKETQNTVIIEELQKKITENANLISALNEQTEKFESEKFKYLQKIEIQEHKLKEYQANLAEVEGAKAAKLEAENKLFLSKLNAKDEEIKKLCNEVKQLKNDLITRNSALNNSSLKENFSKLMNSLSFQEIFVSLNHFFQQLESRFTKIAEEKEYKKFVDINKKNRLQLQEFVDNLLLYSNVENKQEILAGSETLKDKIQQQISILGLLLDCLKNCKNEEAVTPMKEIIENFQKLWLEFNSTLQMLHALNSTCESEKLVNKFTDIFRSFRSTCDYFLSTFNEKFKQHQVDEKLEKEILATLSKMSLQSSGIYRKLTDNTSLLVQVVEMRIIKLTCEQSYENWKQDIESLKAAHSKKIKELEEQISCLSEATTPRSTNSGNAVQSPSEERQNSTDINDFETVASNEVQAAGEEAEIIKFFNARANKLIADRQFAESRVTILKEECEALQRRLEHSLESRLKLEDSIKESQATAKRLQEELQTTTINYEIQLQSMSEHMANMNEKLAYQQEEIEVLKHELNEKVTKKGRSN